MKNKKTAEHVQAKTKHRSYARWKIPFAGFLLALMGGASYAWGVFVVPMTERFGWTKTEATLPFTVFMVVFALAMAPAGKLQDRIGPKKVSAAGALLFLLAYGLASLLGTFTSPWWLVGTYGFLGGIACGLTYACVAPPARKWFPEKPGFAVSLAVMGFGLAALVIAPIKAKYLIPNYGIEGTLLFLAVLTSSVSFAAAKITRNPPAGWLPSEPASLIKKNENLRIREEVLPKKMIREKSFWFIWVTFALVSAGGLVALGFIPSYGEKVIGLTPLKAALAVSFFAAFNGLGRPLAGFLGDKFGILNVMSVTYFVQAVTFLAFSVFAVSQLTLYISAALLGWGYAVTLALFPTLTSLFFGVRHLGFNYGVVFTAFGVGALAPSVGSWITDATGSFVWPFILAGLAVSAGMFLTLVIKRKYFPHHAK